MNPDAVQIDRAAVREFVNSMLRMEFSPRLLAMRYPTDVDILFLQLSGRAQAVVLPIVVSSMMRVARIPGRIHSMLNILSDPLTFADDPNSPVKELKREANVYLSQVESIYNLLMGFALDDAMEFEPGTITDPVVERQRQVQSALARPSKRLLQTVELDSLTRDAWADYCRQICQSEPESPLIQALGCYARSEVVRQHCRNVVMSHVERHDLALVPTADLERFLFAGSELVQFSFSSRMSS